MYILDITLFYHETLHNPQEYSKCSRTNAKYFVDNNFLHSKPKPGQTLVESIHETMQQIEDYTNANMLALNPEKLKIMVISTNQELKKNFQFIIGKKNSPSPNTVENYGQYFN